MVTDELINRLIPINKLMGMGTEGGVGAITHSIFYQPKKFKSYKITYESVHCNKARISRLLN